MESPIRKDALILVGQSSFNELRSRLSCLTDDWRPLLARSQTSRTISSRRLAPWPSTTVGPSCPSSRALSTDLKDGR